MTAVPPDMGELRRLEAAATEGPWFQWFSDAQKADHIRSASRMWVAQFAATEADAALIAALRNSASWLLGQAEAAQRVRELHRQHTEKSGALVCSGCLFEWPCETIRALDGRSG